MSDTDQEQAAGGTGADRSDPGARLAETREARGLGLQAAAESLGVARYILDALESNDWNRLEAPVYVRGYLRKYARLLGLPEDEIVAAYEASAEPRDPVVRAHATSALPHRTNTRWLAPTTAGIVVVVLVLVGIWGWHRLHQRGGTAQVPAAAVSAMMAITRGAPAQTGSAGTPLAATTSAPAQRSVGSGSASMHLELKVRSPSWIEVYGPDHERLYYNLAAAGDTLTFDRSHGPFTIFLGNAGGVQVSLNGRRVAVPPVDRAGKTARLTLGTSQAPASGSAS